MQIKFQSYKSVSLDLESSEYSRKMEMLEEWSLFANLSGCNSLLVGTAQSKEMSIEFSIMQGRRWSSSGMHFALGSSEHYQKFESKSYLILSKDWNNNGKLKSMQRSDVLVWQIGCSKNSIIIDFWFTFICI
jgi:hypothetical protein